MNTTRLIPAVVALPLIFSSLACPTRPVEGGGQSQTGGQGGAPASDAGGSGGGGATGPGGEAGLGEAGGHPLAGSGGPAGTGGDAGTAGGTASGGASGAGGTAGAAGGGTGGSGPGCSPSCNSATQTCVETKCLLNDGQMCALGSQCASNTCTSFYVDQDGDGYGTGPAVGFCGTTAPVGYAAQNGDCCDDASHLAVARLIHPGAGFQTTSAGGVCNITWDYNCSGTVETSFGMRSGGCTDVDCSPIYTPYPESDCGLSESRASCSLGGPAGPNACYAVGGSETLGCK